MTICARDQITRLADELGWATDRGFSLEGSPSTAWAGHHGPRSVHAEFSVRGAITYAATGVSWAPADSPACSPTCGVRHPAKLP